MRDVERSYSKKKVEALPDVSDQIDRVEAAVNDLRNILDSFVNKWGRAILAFVALIAISAMVSAMALVTLAISVING